MTELTIGLVTEGVTDQVVLKHILASSLEKELSGKALKFVDVQPNRDGTSASSSGGWRNILKWCEGNDERERETFFRGMGRFESGNPDCDIILFQIDSDIIKDAANTINKDLHESDLSHVQGKIQRAIWVIGQWLWQQEQWMDKRYIPAPSVEAIETWILAGYQSHDDIECLSTDRVSSALAQILASISGRPYNGRGFGKKRIEKYEKLITNSNFDISRAIAQCVSLNAFLNKINESVSHILLSK